MPNIDVVCNKCGSGLDKKPKIIIENTLYCFCCAKIVVKNENAKRSEAAKRIYQTKLNEYSDLKNVFEKQHSDWTARKGDYSNINIKICCSTLIFIIILCIYTIDLFGKLAIVMLFLLPILYLKMIQMIYQSRVEKFVECNPEPTFDAVTPKIDKISNVAHYIDLTDPWVIVGGNYRDKVLKRDNFTCQWCLDLKMASDLEVHHILPKSRGGPDSFENMITLCKRCHDRETWYGHRRAYPTTF